VRRAGGSPGSCGIGAVVWLGSSGLSTPSAAGWAVSGISWLSRGGEADGGGLKNDALVVALVLTPGAVHPDVDPVTRRRRRSLEQVHAREGKG